MPFAAHTELKYVAHEWENQNIREENWVTLTRELIGSEMQQPQKSKEVPRVEIRTRKFAVKWHLAG